MPYHTVFDITANGYDWTSEGKVLISVIVLILAWWFGPSLFPSWTRVSPFARGLIFSFLIGFAILGAVTAYLFGYAHYSNLRREFEAGRFKVVEGVVSEFDPETVEHKEERFCVQGTCFKYSTWLVTEGFNRSYVAGGPIRLGLPVRVSYVYSRIVKLEVGPFKYGTRVRPELIWALFYLAVALMFALYWALATRPWRKIPPVSWPPELGGP